MLTALTGSFLLAGHSTPRMVQPQAAPIAPLVPQAPELQSAGCFRYDSHLWGLVELYYSIVQPNIAMHSYAKL